MHHIKFKCTFMSVIEEEQIDAAIFIIVRSQIMLKPDDVSQSRGSLLSNATPTLFVHEKLH